MMGEVVSLVFVVLFLLALIALPVVVNIREMRRYRAGLRDLEALTAACRANPLLTFPDESGTYEPRIPDTQFLRVWQTLMDGTLRWSLRGQGRDTETRKRSPKWYASVYYEGKRYETYVGVFPDMPKAVSRLAAKITRTT